MSVIIVVARNCLQDDDPLKARTTQFETYIISAPRFRDFSKLVVDTFLMK